MVNVKPICEHGKRRYGCAACGGKGVCVHGKRRDSCALCRGPRPASRPKQATSAPALASSSRGRVTPPSIKQRPGGPPPLGFLFDPSLGYIASPQTFAAPRLIDGLTVATDVRLVAKLDPTVRVIPAWPMRSRLPSCSGCSSSGAIRLQELPAGKAGCITAAELSSCPTCPRCQSTLVPNTLADVAAITLDTTSSFGELYDYDRMAPRPHEHAAWSLAEYAELGRLLETYQRQPYASLVRVAQQLPDKQPRVIKTRCRDCGTEFNTDYLVGHIVRLARAAPTDPTLAGYLENAPCLSEVRNKHLPWLLAELRQCNSHGRRGTIGPIDWTCSNCAGDRQVASRVSASLQAAHTAASQAGLTSVEHGKVAIPLGVALQVTPGEMPTLHMQGGNSYREEREASCAVLMLVREHVEPLVNAEGLAPLKGAPGLASLHGSLCTFGKLEECKAAAGGEDVDAGLVVIVPGEAITGIMSLAVTERAVRRPWLIHCNLHAHQGAGKHLPHAPASSPHRRH